jgi:hypothetical protein
MPETSVTERARKAGRAGKAPTTRAGEFVREEIHHVREGKHGARSAKQAIAIGLSKARRAGIPLGAPPKGTASARTRAKARTDRRAARHGRTRSRVRARAISRALAREARPGASRRALARQAAVSARKRGARARAAAARKAARTRAKRGQ